MENKVFLEKLKFGIGDGNLQYYLYNWKCPSMDPEKVSSAAVNTNNTPEFYFFVVTYEYKKCEAKESDRI